MRIDIPKVVGNRWTVFSSLILFYLGCALIRTWPLVTRLSAVVPGDGYVFVNGFWWVLHALTYGENPFFSTYLIYPEGTSLAFHTVTFSNGLLFAPVTALFGAAVSVNVAYLCSYVLTALFGYLLAMELTGSGLAALCAGFIVSFGPFHMESGTHHLNLTTIQWLLLYLFLLIRTLKGANRYLPYASGVVAAVVIYTDHFQAILAAGLTLCLLVYFGSNRQPERISLIWRQLASRTVLLTVTAFLLSSPYLYAIIKDLLSQGDITSLPIFSRGGPNSFSGDLFDYFIPYHLGNIVGLGGEYVQARGLYLGVITMLIAGYGVVSGFRCRWIRAVLLGMVGSFILSLGTTLHIKGVWQWHGSSIRLPYYWLFSFPPFSMIRTPYRFHLVTVIAFAMLAAAGIAAAERRLPASIPKWLAALVLLALIHGDYRPPLYSGTPVPVHPFLAEIAADSRDYAVLNLPSSRWGLIKNGAADPSIYMFDQSVHGKRIFEGNLTRLMMNRLNFPDDFLEILCELGSQDQYDREHDPGQGDCSPTASAARAERIGKSFVTERDVLLNTYRIGWILLRNNTVLENSLTRRFLKGFLEMEPECRDGMCLYRLTPISGQ